MRLRFTAIGVNMARGQRQGRIRGQGPAGFGWKDISVAPDLVNGPVRPPFPGETEITPSCHDAGIRHVMEHKSPALCLSWPAFRDVIYFSTPHRRHVPIF